MEKLNLEIVKKLLTNISNPGKLISSDTNDDYYLTKIYQTEYDDIFMKIQYIIDSYGEGNDRITSIEFVRPIKKQVTDFEVI